MIPILLKIGFQVFSTKVGAGLLNKGWCRFSRQRLVQVFLTNVGAGFLYNGWCKMFYFVNNSNSAHSCGGPWISFNDEYSRDGFNPC